VIAPGGTGHLRQGRFESIPVQSGEYLGPVMRYVERNSIRTTKEDETHYANCGCYK
jgi:hypothetical protein